MKLIKTEDAVGQMLCHDMTQIIKGEYKDARFRKGHIVQKEDIPVLLSMGKEHLYVWEIDGSKYHEDEAAEIAALPYDVYNREEAKKAVEGHDKSILRIDSAETQFDHSV